jgi:uncharacterized protein (DUF305 family)
MSAYRLAAIPAIALASALTLTACGGGDDNTPSAPHSGPMMSGPHHSASPSVRGDHNNADVMFAQGMIPHHRQAVEMADLAATRASSPEVKKLAAAIKKAQDPEIQTMSGWLRSWGRSVPEGSGMPGMDHGGHGDHGMGGMMSAEQMERLRTSSGKAFDTAFLEMMIEHHEGAVRMAKVEQAQGAYPPAKEMAGGIITTQNAEIAQMNTMLGR